MNNVTISNKDLANGDEPINLNNGNLVLHYKDGVVFNAYIVTSFRDDKGVLQAGSSTMNYCSFVNLDSGYLAFEERCSRRTTVARVLSHLNHNDFEAKMALKEGQNIEVHKIGDYEIELHLKRKRG